MSGSNAFISGYATLLKDSLSLSLSLPIRFPIRRSSFSLQTHIMVGNERVQSHPSRWDWFCFDLLFQTIRMCYSELGK